ncbi:MAG: GGDEF domain-containing protein [Lachnospiraceae bacterium]|nr:GGDEF domain-containing protein [Lachnospiraceae bacterium]
MLIGILISGITEEYTMNLCSGIESMAAKDGAQCVVIPGKYVGFDYESDVQDKNGHCYNSLFSYGFLSCFDGLIIEMASVLMYADAAKKAKFENLFKDIPHVFVSYDHEDFSCVSIDNKAGLREALEYTLKNGAKTYAMIGGPENNVDAIERRACFEEFMKAHNLPLEEKNYEHGSFWRDCTKNVEKLVSNNLEADVYVGANDILAKRLYESCEKFGRRPGKDVSVIGFDDSDFCIKTYPTISSVKTDIVDMGKMSYELLTETIAGKPHRHAFVPSKFVLRDSICHRNVGDAFSDGNPVRFKDVIKTNIHIEDHLELLSFDERFGTVFDLLEFATGEGLLKLLDQLSNIIDDLFVSHCMKYLDWEIFANMVGRYYKRSLHAVTDSSLREQIHQRYVEYLEKLMKVTQTNDESMGNINTSAVYNMEAFFRETVQFARNTELNYARFLEYLDFMYIKRAYLYLYEKEIGYFQGEVFEVPKYLYLKAYLKDGETVSVPKGKQKIKKNNIFHNDFVDWSQRKRYTLIPINSDNFLYGILVCDIQPKSFDLTNIFACQLGAAVRMLQLRIENNRIMNEYEESVRKLREYNITLDNMSKTDALTGLNNRRGFYVRTEKMMELCPNEKVSLLVGYADMNDLKIINDRFGHDEGDYSLKTIASMLTDFVTEYNGFAARIGGDEFAFAISVPASSDPAIYADEIHTMFATFNETSVKPYNVSVSVGFTMMHSGAVLTIDEALNHADEMLYEEKRLKKGNVIKNVK